ncbi:hypothetical protein BGZ72_009265 [Mortierella alpina]|nr:hypothetical protein BGZ72_009265 [Mortierella alpina]
MMSGRRRTLSNLNGQLEHQAQEQQSSVGSLFRPILKLLTVNPTARDSDDDRSLTAAGCEDLPSPIYGRYGDSEKTGDDCGRKEMHYGFEAGIMQPFEPSNQFAASIPFDKHAPVVDPDIRSLSTSDLLVLESGLQRKVGAIASSGEVIDTPLMNLQEQGYIVVRSRGFESPAAVELSVVTTCDQLECARGEGSPLAMSASLDERYWQPSISMEDLGSIRPLSSRNTAEDLTMEVLKANMDTQDLTSASSVVVTTPGEIIPAGDESSQEASSVEEHEPNRDGDLRRRLWNTGVLELDLNLDLKQEDSREDTASPVKHGNNDSTTGLERTLDYTWEAGQDESILNLSSLTVLEGSMLNLTAHVALPESPVSAFDDEYANFTPFYYLPSLPPSPELDTASSFEDKRVSEPGMSLSLLPPLPISPIMGQTPRQCTFAVGCIPLAMLPPLPPSPEPCSKPLSITTSPSLLLLPPLPPSPAESVCTPKSLEIASTKAQLRYWSQTAARLRDQEQVLTARIDILVQEMAQVLNKCQETELGLLARETIVQELRRELVKEQEFGFASVQEAALSIQEKCLLESELEESWRELRGLREAWMHQQQVLKKSLPQQEATVSAFEHKNKKAQTAEQTPSPCPLHVRNLQSEITSPRAMVKKSTHRRPARLTLFHGLVKLLCLALICTMALVSMVVLLYGQQHHLHQIYQIVSKHASQLCFDMKFTYRQIEAVAAEVFAHMQMLLQRKQKTAGDHVHSMTELFWTAAELWADLDMADLWQSLQISRTWS